MRVVLWSSHGSTPQEVVRVVHNHFELYSQTGVVGVFCHYPPALSREAREWDMPHTAGEGFVRFTRVA